MLKKLSFIFAFLFLLPINAYASCSAQSAIVIDSESKTVLYEKNAYQPMPMASTTKIMTALIAIENGGLDDVVTITDSMVATEGSCLGLRAGDKISMYDLLVGMMLTSGNDAANSVAEFIGGDRAAFVSMMNKRAKELGMKDTTFVTPSGLDEKNHHSTAYDMAILTANAVRIREFCDIVSRQSADILINDTKLTVYNHNKLLARDKDVFGVKTGYTKKAGRCLVSAKKYEGNVLVCVTLNAPDDWNDHLALYKSCQKEYNRIEIKNSIVLNTVGADKETVNCSYKKEFYLIGEPTVKEYYYPFVYAPIKKGQVIGLVLIYVNDKIIERLPIEADEEISCAKQE